MPDLIPSGKTFSPASCPNDSYKLDPSKIRGASYKLEDFMHSSPIYSAPSYRNTQLQRTPTVHQDSYNDSYILQQRTELTLNSYNSRRQAA